MCQFLDWGNFYTCISFFPISQSSAPLHPAQMYEWVVGLIVGS